MGSSRLHRHNSCGGRALGTSAGGCGLACLFVNSKNQGIEGQDWETINNCCKELHQAVGTKKPGESLTRHKAKASNPVGFVGRTSKKSVAALAKASSCLDAVYEC